MGENNFWTPVAKLSFFIAVLSLLQWVVLIDMAKTNNLKALFLFPSACVNILVLCGYSDQLMKLVKK